MSASTEKKTRREAIEAGVNKKAAAAKVAEEKAAKEKRNWIIGIAIFALLLVCAVIINSGVINRNGTAATVNGVKITPAELGYYMKNDENYMAQLAAYGLSLDDYTREDYMEMALTELEEVKGMVDYANKNGIALTNEEILRVKSDMGSTQLQVMLAGQFKDIDSYYTYVYGTGVDSALVEKILCEQALADKVYDVQSETYTFSPEELDARYATYEGDRDYFNYLQYYVAAEAEEDGTVIAESLADARTRADEISAAYAAAEGEDYTQRFDTAISSVLEGNYCEEQNVTGSAAGSALKPWLTSADVKEGDCTVLDDGRELGYYVLVFLGRSDNSYATVAMRHILIKAEADEAGVITDEAKAAAHASAQDIFDQWKSGDATEDSFAELVYGTTQDTGSADNGGLYENFPRGQMVPEIDSWVFSADRKPGDVEIIDVESEGYTGTHIVYFVGTGDTYAHYQAKTDLVSEAMSAWTGELYAGYEGKKAWAGVFAGK